jgi:hypothetical protein
MKRFLASALILTLTFLGFHLFAQDISQWASTQKTTLYEKVYLHTDRELYSTGDTLWFKSYLVSGLTNKLELGYKNIYVQLVSPTGKVVANRLLLSIFGEANGDIALTDSLVAGQYTLRAYTKYLENFGEESYFHRKLWVSKPQSPKELYLPAPVDSSKIDALFFPAGGNLVLNAANHIAFKIVGLDGKGVEATGKVFDGTGKTITTFKTSYLGMGKFIFMPEEGKTYYATIDNFPNFKYEFRNILAEGVSLGFKDLVAEVMVSLSRNIKAEGTQTFWLAASHKGVPLFYREVSMDNPSQAMKLSKHLFPRGITKLTLFDTNLNIIAERLVFVDVYNTKSINLKTDKEKYSTREKVEMEVAPVLPEGDSMESNLSVAVVDEGYFGEGGPAQTIESYLLVDSELKGAIESPASYFYDSDSITSQEKLDLLMMVQGWRSYYWDEILEKAPKDTTGWDDAGISVGGRVKYMFRDKPVVGGKVVFGPYSRNFLFEQTKTDSLGRFRFDRLYLQDSSSVIVDAWTPEGKRNAQILPSPGLKFDSVLAITPINNTVFNLSMPQKYMEKTFKKLMAKDKFDPDAGSILLGEVNVVALKYIKNKNFYEFVKPFTIPSDRTLNIKAEDYDTYTYFYEYLEQHSMFRFDGEELLYGADTKETPRKKVILLYLDGIKIGSNFLKDIIANLSLDEVFLADIYRQPQGSQGVDFIISVVTKWEREEFKPKQWGRTILRTYGFQQPNAFYSPKYTSENFYSKTQDKRITLYWSPSIKVENGKANLEFYTCDNLGNYVAIVEGISKNGKIISGAKRFSVTEFNPSLKK